MNIKSMTLDQLMIYGYKLMREKKMVKAHLITVNNLIAEKEAEEQNNVKANGQAEQKTTVEVK